MDAQFVGLLQSYAEEHQSLAEQLEATRNILEAAKKDASKKAEGAIRKSAPAKMTPAADDDDDETETPEVVGGQVEDNLFA